MSLMKIISEQKIHDSIDDAKQFLQDNDIDLEDANLEYYVGSGFFADVYKVKNKNKAIKFYNPTGTDEQGLYENDKYDIIIKHSNKLDNVCNVYLNREIGSSGIYIAVMDFLEDESPINKMDQDLYSFISHLEPNYLQYKEFGDGKDIKKNIKKTISLYVDNANDETTDDVKQILKPFIEMYGNDKEFISIIFYIFSEYTLPNSGGNNRPFEKSVHELTTNEKYFRDIFKGIREYEMMGIEHGDIHTKNILFDPKQNNYKLIDPI